MVLQAVKDLAIGTLREKNRAVAWMHSPSFEDVCDAADLHPDTVRKIVAQITMVEDHDKRVWLLARLRERL